jgi:hypothetical protein
MSFLARLFGRTQLTDDEKQKRGARLEAKRKHLRGKMAQTTGEIRRSWTDYRTWRGDDAGKKRLKLKIKHLEAERKLQRKEMLKLMGEMKRLGFEAAAGWVEVS